MNRLLTAAAIVFSFSFAVLVLLVLIINPGLDFAQSFLKISLAAGCTAVLVFSSFFVSRSLVPPIWSAAALAFTSRLAGSLIVLLFYDSHALSEILPYNGPGFWGMFFMLWGTFSMIKRFEGGKRKFPVYSFSGLVFLAVIPLCISRQASVWLNIYIVLVAAALLVLCFQGLSIKAFREYRMFVFSILSLLSAESMITAAESYGLFYFSAVIQVSLPALALLCLKGLAVREKNKVVR